MTLWANSARLHCEKTSLPFVVEVLWVTLQAEHYEPWPLEEVELFKQRLAAN
jgi:hypothetical protein